MGANRRCNTPKEAAAVGVVETGHLKVFAALLLVERNSCCCLVNRKNVSCRRIIIFWMERRVACGRVVVVLGVTK
jgi:hypothetical protein